MEKAKENMLVGLGITAVILTVFFIIFMAFGILSSLWIFMWTLQESFFWAMLRYSFGIVVGIALLGIIGAWLEY